MATFSLDIVTGWDFCLPEARRLACELLARSQITFAMICPPRRAFSELQRLWNLKRMSLEKQRALLQEGMLFLEHAMEAASVQLQNKNFFAFEHPARASSWRTPCVQAIQRKAGVHTVTIDMCQFGLRSKVLKTPMRKRD